MPKYDVVKVTEALTFLKAGELPQNEIARKCGMGVSTLQRHAELYRRGERPDVDVGELPPARLISPPSGYRHRGSKDTRKAGRSLSDYLAGMLRDADVFEARAAALRLEAEELEAEAMSLREAADRLRGV